MIKIIWFLDGLAWDPRWEERKEEKKKKPLELSWYYGEYTCLLLLGKECYDASNIYVEDDMWKHYMYHLKSIDIFNLLAYVHFSVWIIYKPWILHVNFYQKWWKDFEEMSWKNTINPRF